MYACDLANCFWWYARLAWCKCPSDKDHTFVSKFLCFEVSFPEIVVISWLFNLWPYQDFPPTSYVFNNAHGVQKNMQCSRSIHCTAEECYHTAIN